MAKKSLAAERRGVLYAREQYGVEIQAMIDAAVARGKREGELNGLRRGRREGIRKGKRKGMEECAYTIAINALRKKMAVKDVVAITGLTRREVEDLRR